jgi:hypothetical protein
VLWSDFMTPAPGAGLSLLPAVALSGLSRWALWVEYMAVGGEHPVDELTAYLSGLRVWTALEHDRLAVALNEACSDMGLGNPAGYYHEITGS